MDACHKRVNDGASMYAQKPGFLTGTRVCIFVRAVTLSLGGSLLGSGGLLTCGSLGVSAGGGGGSLLGLLGHDSR